MPAKKTDTSHTIYQLKMTLRGAKPPIWRRLLVPSGMTFAQLHNVLQVAMGWANYHLHEFEIGKQRIGVPGPEDDFMDMPPLRNERTVRLFSVLDKVGAKGRYTYDFGDSWEHSISIEKVRAPEPGAAYPVCTGGAGKAPPEDCGGIPGFYDLLDILNDPKHEEHAAMREWVGGYFDPTAFSIDEVNRELGAMRRRRIKG
ncbi:MAG: plasmid pRiA4b ORF-3 family protein [Bryobacteraceae bacterium]